MSVVQRALRVRLYSPRTTKRPAHECRDERCELPRRALEKYGFLRCVGNSIIVAGATTFHGVIAAYVTLSLPMGIWIMKTFFKELPGARILL